jgi:hypothetical protein
MAEIHSFLEGLFGGIAGGWANEMMLDRKEAMDRENRQIDLIGKLLQQGQYDVVGAMDPDLLGRVFGKKDVQRVQGIFSGLGDLAARSRKAELEGTQARTQATQEQITTTQQMRGPQVRTAGAAATTAEANASVADELARQSVKRGAAQTAVAETTAQTEPQRQQLELEAAQKKITQIGQQISMNNQQITMVHETMDELNKIAPPGSPERTELLFPELVQNKLRQAQLRGANVKAEMLQKELDIINSLPAELQRYVAVPQLANQDDKTQQKVNQLLNTQQRIFSLHPKDKENQPIPFPDQGSAKSFANRLNATQTQINTLMPEIAQTWEAVPDNSGWFGGTKGYWVVPKIQAEQAGVAAGTTPAVSPAEQRLNERFGLSTPGSTASTAPAAPTATQPPQRKLSPSERTAQQKQSLTMSRQQQSSAMAATTPAGRMAEQKKFTEWRNEFTQEFKSVQDAQSYLPTYIEMRNNGASKEEALKAINDARASGAQSVQWKAK